MAGSGTLTVTKRKMAMPAADRSMRLCVVRRKRETVIYGNVRAFRNLARWMAWLANSDPSEHFEIHVPWSFQSPYWRTKVVTVLEESRGTARRPSKDFEVRFMVLTPKELKALSKARPRRKRKGTPKSR